MKPSNLFSFNYSFSLNNNIQKLFHSFRLVNPILKLEVQIVMVFRSKGD